MCSGVLMFWKGCENTLKISINCPSYKRPKVETLDYISTCKVWVAEREYEDYLKANPGFEQNIISVPNEVQGNLCRIRNYILDHELAENDAVLLIDDDMHSIGRFDSLITSPSMNEAISALLTMPFASSAGTVGFTYNTGTVSLRYLL